MAVHMNPYSHNAFAAFPFVDKGQSNLDNTLAERQLSDIVGKIFIDYGVESLFGIILLHKHFDMEPNEKLVHFGNSAIPWDIKQEDFKSEVVIPIAWHASQGGISPYEWRYISPSEKKPPTLDLTVHGAFLSTLMTTLYQNQLDKTVGIYAIEDPDINKSPLYEITTQRANINLKVDIFGDQPSYETNWQFYKGKGGFLRKACARRCIETAAGAHIGHDKF